MHCYRVGSKGTSTGGLRAKVPLLEVESVGTFAGGLGA